MRFIPSVLFALWGLQIATAQTIDPQNITIIRDTFGIPHIFAPTDAEAAYGLAYAHAEDDFESIQKAMLASRGMLCEVEGKKGVLFDFVLKFLNIDSLVDARYELDLSADYHAVLDGYVQGLNDYANAHPKEIARKKLLPIVPQDVIKGYTVSLALMAGLGVALKAVNDNMMEDFFSMNDLGTGSNAMAVSPKRMDDGKSYLLVNSHQPIEGRFSWYEAHVSSEEGWNIAGGLFAGGTSIFVGSNNNLGWAHTTNYHQFGEVYQLEINPKNKGQYIYDGEWKDFYVRKIKLKVKLAGMRIPITRKVKTCEYGPVFENKHGSFAFRFPAFTEIRAGEQWFRMNKARNLDEFTHAIKMQALPLFNIIYADKDGNIMLHSGGKVPDRNPELDWKLPIKNNTSDYKWTDILPFEKIPHVENPDCGYVYNANNSPLQCTGEGCGWNGDFPGLHTFNYNRGERFGHLFKELNETCSETDLANIKYDMSYHPSGTYAHKLKAMYELDENKYPDIADAIIKMKNWNWSGEADDPHAALAMVIHANMMEEVNAPLGFMMLRQADLSEEMAVRVIRKAKKFLLKTHGSIDVTLGDVQRLIRGKKSLPAHGLREVLRAADTELFNKKKGIYKVVGGDGYIQIARFSENGAEIKSINVYGASNRPESPHYDDQMEMFNAHEFKNMPLDRKSVEAMAERIYHPGE